MTLELQRRELATLRLEPRERVSTAEYPNFRGKRRSVEGPLMRLLSRMQHRNGPPTVSEGSLRRMICQDTGCMPGVDTVREALRRLESRGLLLVEWLGAGGIMYDGEPTPCGCMYIRVARDHVERAQFRQRVRARPSRRERVFNRVNHHAAAELAEHVKRIAPRTLSPSVDEREASARRSREEQLRWIAEHGAELDKPPDRRGPP